MIAMTSAQMAEMRRAATAPNRYRNEKIWTLLVADAIDRSADPSKMMEWLCGRPVQAPSPLAVWFEAQPISPRFGKAAALAPAGPSEGNTKLDLAVGHIRRRAGTAGGIEYGPHVEDSWVCFVEAKCLADCSHDVSYDPLRNQLARVIENLLCFQGDGQFPEQLYFTLLTPRLFRDTPAGRRSRLYAYKMAEYEESPDQLLDDLNDCRIIPRQTGGYLYPNLEERIARTRARWVTFEEALEPDWGQSLDIALKAKAVADLDARVLWVLERITRAADGKPIEQYVKTRRVPTLWGADRDQHRPE